MDHLVRLALLARQNPTRTLAVMEVLPAALMCSLMASRGCRGRALVQGQLAEQPMARRLAGAVERARFGGMVATAGMVLPQGVMRHQDHMALVVVALAGVAGPSSTVATGQVGGA